MKALRFFEPGRVGVVDVADPAPEQGEAILKLHATGLCNSDVRVYLGEKKAAAGVVPGHEMTGEVVHAPTGSGVAAGDVVSVCPILCDGTCSFCRDGFRNRCPARKTLGYDLDGGIAEYVRIPARMVELGHLLPVDRETAPYVRGLVEPLACVLNSLDSIGVKSGMAMAIVGGGPMGLLHLLAARAYSAGPILVVEPDEVRRNVAIELGADATAAPGEASETAKEMTGGEGFRSVAMAVGLADALPTALDICRRLGAINLFAGFPPGSSHALDLNRVHYDEVRLLGTQNAPFHLYERSAAMIGEVPGIERIVTHRYRLEDAAEAYSARLGREGLKSAVVMS